MERRDKGAQPVPKSDKGTQKHAVSSEGFKGFCHVLREIEIRSEFLVSEMLIKELGDILRILLKEHLYTTLTQNNISWDG